MTATAVPTIPDRLDDTDYQAAVDRLRAFRRQLEQADEQTDAGSLDRAADLAKVYADKRWVDELPAPTKTHHRGRPVVPDSRSRFAKWAKEKLDLGPVYSYRLLRADEVRGIVLPTGKVIPGLGERALRPLYKVIKEQRGQEAPDVWRRAVQLADGGTPTGVHVRKALADHDKAMGRTPASRAKAYEARTVRDAWKRFFQAFDYIGANADEDQLKAGLAEFQQRLETLERDRAQPTG